MDVRNVLNLLNFLNSLNFNLMKRILLTLSFLSFLFYSNAQKIINLVYVGDKGVTDNIRDTKYFIVVKQFPGGFQRLDYKMHGPLMNVKTYSDSGMKMLNGVFYSYRENGRLQISGSYNNNKKNNDWYYYNDTFKVIKKKDMQMASCWKRSIPIRPGKKRK
jgi:hypothetical protein